ncbi:hypothetical protein RJ639_013007 [Escallonia herrerae]|uniref:Sulfotransferase n=1 Tax=Escallonia herrerae TaxID=1293975 RepID=A0AA88VR53_9ASTE|nr:hypothetical protein RJ639_013007 [Escallonia herrerae]
MAASLLPHLSNTEFEETYRKCSELIKTLPKGKAWRTEHVVQYQGFWLNTTSALKGVLLVQDHFKARATDIILSAFMKCGTTWLRSLMFATANRYRFDLSTHPLLKTGPHDCFPMLDSYIYQGDSITHLELLPSPRLFASHMALDLFPKSVLASGCKFVYICRDPKDVLISKWHFMNKLRVKELAPLTLPEAYELFCQGVSEFGPFWDHVLGYWKASLELPDKILFLKYEDMKREPSVHLKRLAEFMGQPFSMEEEKKGLVEEILKLCSFENLSNLEVNKAGIQHFSDQLVIENRHFFRKGQIGDWENHLTEEMKNRIDRITEQKLKGSGLTLGASPLHNCSSWE